MPLLAFSNYRTHAWLLFQQQSSLIYKLTPLFTCNNYTNGDDDDDNENNK